MASEVSEQEEMEEESIGGGSSFDDDERPHSGLRARSGSDGEGEDPNSMTMGMFFKQVMNNGAEDNVACCKLIVMLILVLAALLIGNAAYIFTTREVNDDYEREVSVWECIHVCFIISALISMWFVIIF